MAWTDSRIGRSFLADTLAGTAVFDLDAPSDVYKVALYGTTPTPDRDAVSASFAYNAGQWVVGNEISSAGQWAAGGVALATMTITTSAGGIVIFDAQDTASGTTATLTGVFGTFIYNDTKTTPVADQGVCFNYLGGTNSVTSGQFTVVWNTNGIWRITV
jgi:hypothetical protein